MKILVLGDSFAHHSEEGNWPHYLQELTNSEVVCAGQNGCSNYYIYTKFLEHHDDSFDYIIIFLTSNLRTPIVNGYPHLSAFLSRRSDFENLNYAPKDYDIAIKMYLKYFFDENLLEWITRNVIKDIEDTVKDHQKIIWVDASFSAEKTKLSLHNTTKKGIKTKGCLSYFSFKVELEETFKIRWSDYFNIVNIDGRPNHFTKVNQLVIAKFLANIIQKSENLTENDLDLNSLDWVTDPKQIFPYLVHTDKQRKQFLKKIKDPEVLKELLNAKTGNSDIR